MKPRRVKLRLFIEGVEVPVISAAVTTQPNSPASATIQVVPTDGALEILPRSLVHLFFYDYMDGPGDNIYVGGGGVDEQKLGLEAAEIEKNKYRILFFGEILGLSHQKTSSGRSIVLQCLDLSNYWDACKYYKRGWGYKSQFAGVAYKTLNELLTSTGEVIFEKLTTPPPGHKNLTGFVGGIVHLLQAIGGIYRNDTKFKGTSAFFSLAELRLRLSGIIAAPDDPTPEKLLSKSGFGSIWDKNIRRLGREFTFRKAVMAIAQYIFYEVYPNPCCMVIPSDNSAVDDSDETFLKDHPKWRYIITDVRGMIESIDSMLGDLEEAGDFADADRQMKMVEMISGLENMHSRLNKMADRLKAESPTETKVVTKTTVSYSGYEEKKKYKKTVKTGGLMKVRGRVSSAAQKVKEARKACKKGKKDLSSLPAGKKNKEISKALDKAESKLREILGLTLKGKRGASFAEPPRMANQIFRPDIWFVPPPRCNVIFPDRYNQIAYSRTFTTEVTRLLVRTHSSYGSDMMFDNFYYAPSAEGMLRGKDIAYKQSKEVGLGYMVANRDIMEHELYTGIVPHFERASGLKVYGVRSGKVVAGAKTERIAYAQRLANFLLFKYRYAPRTINVDGPFNPYLAPGFPALVIDKHINKKQAEEITNILQKTNGDLSEIRNKTGTHFLGTILMMTHNVTQNSASTSLQLNYARSHKEHIDPLGADKITAKAIKGEEKKKYRVCALPDYAPQRGKDEGLYGGEVLYAIKVPGNTEFHPLWNSPRKKKKGSVYTQVQGNTKKTAKAHGPEVVAMAGSATAVVTFTVYEVVEKKDKIEKRVIDMPFEEIVRPAWYGDIWSNRLVGGAAYQPLIGTGAITDPIVVKDGTKTYSTEDADTVKQESSAKAKDQDFSIVVSALEDDATIENAIDFLVYVYSQIVQKGLDSDSFVHSYTWRPIASMFDFFGTSDLEYDEEGQVLSGVEGFHSKAFGQYNNLFAFTSEDVVEILGVSRNKKATYTMSDGTTYETEVPISQRLDVRKQRQDQILAYVRELEDKGLIG